MRFPWVGSKIGEDIVQNDERKRFCHM